MNESLKGMKRTHRANFVNESLIGKTVTVNGWVNANRNIGSLIFVQVRDVSGVVQVVFDESSLSKELFEKAEKLRSEYCIAVTGEVIARSPEAVNEKMATGKVEIKVTDFRILSEAEVPPFEVKDGIETNEELRLKYRYLDLRRPELLNILKLRSKVTNYCRRFYEEEGFLEVETPILNKSTPEGARDYLVPSRVHPGSFYALPQSPQIFKQILMCSGFDRYMQIAKCFRDEDLRADRQPEFTQIDLEMSFIEEDDIMEVNERMLKGLFKEVAGIDIETPFRRMSYKEAMEKYGSDKPDLRFGLEINDISEEVKDLDFVVFKSALETGSVRCINLKGHADIPRKQLDALVEYIKTVGGSGLAWHGITAEGETKSSIAKFMTPEVEKAIYEKCNVEKGDILLIVADKKDKTVYTALGALRCELAKKYEMYDPNSYNFLWVVDFPVFEWSDEENRYQACHHPFTMVKDEDLPLLDNPETMGEARAKAYDIVINGYEAGGGSIRIYQKDIQAKMFKLLGLTEEVANERFGFLLDAFKYGVPPHGGMAYGLDRLIMLLAHTDNIRDVIAFPKTNSATCLMSDCPNTVDQIQLDDLQIKIDLKEKK
ncbi:MAG: aspartate--tRNA ligase [Clostridia bacterium]|nr:aspartate--tRNA ligase [Clostridia bacterium]